MKKLYNTPRTLGMPLMQATILCTSDEDAVTSFTPANGGGANPNAGV